MTSGPARLSEVDETPVLVIDRSRAMHNGQRMHGIASELGLSLRPHMKTHKTVEMGLWQLYGTTGDAYGSTGTGNGTSTRSCGMIVVSTIAEALQFSQHEGFQDILFGLPISAHKLTVLLEESSRRGTVFRVLVDHEDQVSMIETVVQERGYPQPVSVFIKFDCGYGRCGVPLSNETDSSDQTTVVALAKRILSSASCSLDGIYSHSGHAYGSSSASDCQCFAQDEVDRILEAVASLHANDIRVDTISVGSTPATSHLHQKHSSAFPHSVTEIHPGNYILYDRQQNQAGACSLDDIAVSVVGRVLSHYPDRRMVLVDIGALALSKDTAPDGYFGQVVGHPDLKVAKISQEHGLIVDTRPSTTPQRLFETLPIGSTVRVYPNHACLVTACFPRFYVVDGDADSDAIVDTIEPCRYWY